MPTIYVTARQLARRNNIHLRLILWTIVSSRGRVSAPPLLLHTHPSPFLPDRKWVLTNLEDLLGFGFRFEGVIGIWFWELWIEVGAENLIEWRIISFVFHWSREYFFENFESWILRTEFPIKRTFHFYIHYKVAIMDYAV